MDTELLSAAEVAVLMGIHPASVLDWHSWGLVSASVLPLNPCPVTRIWTLPRTDVHQAALRNIKRSDWPARLKRCDSHWKRYCREQGIGRLSWRTGLRSQYPDGTRAAFAGFMAFFDSAEGQG